MELKVMVEGVERCVSGLTSTTTCADIIYALAHFTGQKGRFVLVEKRLGDNTEHSLAPNDRPLELLNKTRDQIIFTLRQVQTRLPSSSTTSSMLDPNDTTPIYARPNNSINTTSSASLPGPLVRFRPPPPAYHQVIEQRYNSLSRRPPRSVPSGSDSTLFRSPNLTLAELERLVEAQRIAIETQNNRLTEYDTDADQREMAQLERQLTNLRLVLQPLRSAAWGTRLSAETSTRDGYLHSIAALKARIEFSTRAVNEQLAMETDLSAQLERNIRQLMENNNIAS